MVHNLMQRTDVQLEEGCDVGLLINNILAKHFKMPAAYLHSYGISMIIMFS